MVIFFLLLSGRRHFSLLLPPEEFLAFSLRTSPHQDLLPPSQQGCHTFLSLFMPEETPNAAARSLSDNLFVPGTNTGPQPTTGREARCQSPAGLGLVGRPSGAHLTAGLLGGLWALAPQVASPQLPQARGAGTVHWNSPPLFGCFCFTASCRTC